MKREPEVVYRKGQPLRKVAAQPKVPEGNCPANRTIVPCPCDACDPRTPRERRRR